MHNNEKITKHASPQSLLCPDDPGFYSQWGQTCLLSQRHPDNWNVSYNWGGASVDYTCLPYLHLYPYAAQRILLKLNGCFNCGRRCLRHGYQSDGGTIPLIADRQILGTYQVSYSVLTGGYFPRDKADYSLPSNVEDRISGVITRRPLYAFVTRTGISQPFTFVSTNFLSASTQKIWATMWRSYWLHDRRIDWLHLGKGPHSPDAPRPLDGPFCAPYQNQGSPVALLKLQMTVGSEFHSPWGLELSIHHNYQIGPGPAPGSLLVSIARSC